MPPTDPTPEDHSAESSRTISQQLLSSNEHWARDISRLSPEVFQRSAREKQKPH
ncbi:hypothetical protein APHAL10511_008239, partial [Amanita phalloides]